MYCVVFLTFCCCLCDGSSTDVTDVTYLLVVRNRAR